MQGASKPHMPHYCSGHTLVHALVQRQRQASAAVQLAQLRGTRQRLFNVLQPRGGHLACKQNRLLQRPAPVGVCAQRHARAHRSTDGQHRGGVLGGVAPPRDLDLQGGKGLQAQQGDGLRRRLLRAALAVQQAVNAHRLSGSQRDRACQQGGQ